jgi:hypothetical protein
MRARLLARAVLALPLLPLLAAGMLAGAPHRPGWRPRPAARAGTSHGGGTASRTGGTATLLAAGDITTCNRKPSPGAFATAAILGANRGEIAVLGDGNDRHGYLWGYRHCYRPTWGRYLRRTRPVPGNHDYRVPGAAGYFTYFGARAGERGKGYYSYTLGSWHIVALNSNCPHIGGCEPGSREWQWLRADLAAHRSRCILAYWHHPLFTSATPGSGATDIRPLWELLYQHGADVIVNAHRHQYERFAPQTPWGTLRRRGIREFVAGTGGTHLEPFRTVKPGSQARNDTAHGVLRLRLGRGWYQWKFLAAAGQSYSDSGFARCH